MKRVKSTSISHVTHVLWAALFFLLAVLVSSCGERISDKSKDTEGPSIEYIIINGRPAIKIYTTAYTLIDTYDTWIPVLYQDKDFNAIEKYISDLLNQKANEANAHELYVFYRSLTRVTKNSDAELMKNVLHEWCDKHPTSHIPWLVRGAFYISYAYPRSSAAYTQAQMDLEKSQQLNPNDPNASCFLIELAKLLNFSREKMEHYYNKGVAACPFHFGLHYNKFEYLTPRWHGSTDEMLNFADECLMLAEQYPSLGLIMIDALEELHDKKHKKENYLGSDDIWPTVERIYNAFFTAYPDDIHRRFFYAYHAYKAEKYDIALEQFEIIGDRWMDETPWNSIIDYHNSRACAYLEKGMDCLLNKKLYRISIDYLRKAAKYNPNDLAYYRLGQAYMYSGITGGNISVMLMGEETLKKAIQLKGPNAKYARDELQKLQEYLKKYGQFETHRIYDEAGFLPKYDARRFEEHLGWIFYESDIDIRFVFVKDSGNKTIEELAAQKVQQLGIGGKSREERGVLLLFDLKNKELRVEVGYGLEEYFPDGFVGYLVHYHTRDFFAIDDVTVGLRLLIRMLHQRIREQTLGNNFDPRIVEIIKKQGYLSGGAGISANMPEKGENKVSFLAELNDKERQYYCAQPTPQAVYEKFLEWIAAGKFDPRIDIFTPQSQIYLSSLPISKAYFHYWLMLEYKKSYKIFIKNNVAMQYFTDTPFVVPHFYMRTNAGWQMDICMEVKNTRNRRGCIYTWDYVGINDIYTKTFSDNLVNIKNYVRIKDGDNRELPIRGNR